MLASSPIHRARHLRIARDVRDVGIDTQVQNADFHRLHHRWRRGTALPRDSWSSNRYVGKDCGRASLGFLLHQDCRLSAAGLFLLGVFAAVVNTFAKYLMAQASTSSVVQIESATVNSDDVRSYLPARAKELGHGVRLEALYEVQVPPLVENFGSSEAAKLPEDLKLEIQGVNVPSFSRVSSRCCLTTGTRFR